MSTILLVSIIAVVVLAVPCIGVLSAIAIPAFIGFTRRSKVAEARSNLRVLASAVDAYCEAEHVATGPAAIGAATTTGTLPAATGPIPSVIPVGAVVATPELAADAVFSELRFAPTEPIRYSYSIVAESPTAILIRARGDLDNDGITSLFEIRCTSSAGACECDRTVRVENELE